MDSPPIEAKKPPHELLYVDNFRGFLDTVIPLRDVTFFVGDNSTGKSSIISLLNLVSATQFWIDPDFDTEDQHLGSFFDLVNTNSAQRHFTIGTAKWQASFAKEKDLFVMFATYSSNEGLPYVSKLSFLADTLLVTVIHTSTGVYYRHSVIPRNDGSSELSPPYFLEVARHHKRANKKNSSALSEDQSNRTNISLFHFIATAQRKLPSNENNSADEKSIPSIYNYISYSSSAVWLAPIRTKPRRTYDGAKKPFSSEGYHTPYLLKKQLGKKGTADRFRKLIAQLGHDSHLFKDIRIKTFGTSEGAPFEVQVDLDGLHLGLSNVGYGVSQVLPILAEILIREKSCLFHIQQPEVHLHPRAQASLGDIFYSLALNDKKRFVIETHSDFLIDRFRAAMASHNTKPSFSASIVFFARKSSRNSACELILSDNGSYPSDQPREFRDFFIHEQIRNLGI